MHTIRFFSLTLLAAAALAGCSTVPPPNAQLDQAHSAYSAAQANGQILELAPAELKQAGEALALADAAQARNADTAQVDQLAYLATQRVALAQATGDRKAAEASVATAGAQRDKMRLAARTREADNATQLAAQSQMDAQAAQRQADASQQQAATSQQLAMASQQQTGEAERRSRALEAQLAALNAKATDRGMVITIGDVLFDTDRALLKSGSLPAIERLGDFLKAYPQRKAVIEGYTDSTGSEDHNMALSSRRADAVRTALLSQGVGTQQIAAQGYGESHPVAGNDSSGGRQMNRRVEIVLSDENGVIAPR